MGLIELTLSVELGLGFVNGIVTFNALFQFIPAVDYHILGLTVGPGLLKGF